MIKLLQHGVALVFILLTVQQTAAGPSASVCATYCSTVEANCTNIWNIFGEFANASTACSIECSFYNSGGSTLAGDSVTCRWTAAQSENCNASAPNGGGLCGSACDNYCDKYMSVCNSTYSQIQFATHTACVSECLNFYPNVSGTLVTAGDSAQCRFYHASLAAINGPLSVHCPHASPFGDLATGAGVCGNKCNSYCDHFQTTCQSFWSSTFNSNYSNCLSTCASYPTCGNYGDASLDSFFCRYYHVNAAAANTSYHCPHASPSGGGICVGSCSSSSSSTGHSAASHLSPNIFFVLLTLAFTSTIALLNVST